MVHASALFAGHAAQATPNRPHAISVPALQTPAAQHPLGHEVASHWHLPATQRWPAAQAAPVPQVHAPAVEQVSATFASHVAHAAPAAPQVVSERVTQAFA